MYLRLAVSEYSILKIVYFWIVEFFIKCECFCASLSCCPQHAAWGHVDNVASFRTASAKEMAIEIIVVLLGRDVYLNLKTFLLVL